MLGPDEWVVGGIVSSEVLAAVRDAPNLAALDDASLGRPVMLRDDTMHNRWVKLPGTSNHGGDRRQRGPGYRRVPARRARNPVGVLLRVPPPTLKPPCARAHRTRMTGTDTRCAPHCRS